jgi:hypothetical protein
VRGAHVLLDQPRRRTVRDYERLPQHHAAMIQWAMIALMTRRLAHHHNLKPLFTRL